MMTSDNVMRMPCETPREAMAWMCTVLGGIMAPDIDGDDRLPTLALSFKSGNHEGHLRVSVVLDRRPRSGSRLLLRVDVGWPSLSTLSATEAAAAASLHTVIAHKAQLAESLASGREWSASEILGGGSD